MAAQTTTKVAVQTGAAKDDLLIASTTGLTEDNLQSNLNVLANDPGAAKLYSLSQNVSGYTLTTQFPVTTSVTLASGATITMNADGTVGYDASGLQKFLQSYAEGESFTDSFVYTVRMANGALSTAKVTVSIAGANDKPTLASVAPHSILDTAEDDTPDAITGTLVGSDVDHGAVLAYSFDDGSLVKTSEYGTLTLDAKTGEYSFVADPDKIDALAAGMNATAEFAVLVKDEHGAASDTVKLAFDLIGANDTASISGTASGAVAEDGTLQASGALIVSDRDAGQSAFQSPSSLTGVYGDFTFDAGTGEWTYTLRNGDVNVQALNGDQKVFDELVITSLDGSASETIRVGVTGAAEALPPAENPITAYIVNHGQSDINDRVYFKSFDSNDVLKYANNYTFKGTYLVDTNDDGTLDSSAAKFEFTNNGGKISVVEAILVGYTGLTDAQIVG